MRAWLKDPKRMTVFHGWAAITWLVLSLLTTVAAIIFPDHPLLMAWVIFMSGYANTTGHWAAKQGAESEASDEISPKMKEAIEKAVAQGMARSSHGSTR